MVDVNVAPVARHIKMVHLCGTVNVTLGQRQTNNRTISPTHAIASAIHGRDSRVSACRSSIGGSWIGSMVQSTFVDITAVWSLRHPSSTQQKHQGTLVQVPWASIRREGRMLRILDCGVHSQRDGWLSIRTDTNAHIKCTSNNRTFVIATGITPFNA